MATPKLSKTPPGKPPNITRADIEQYLKLEEQRREVNRQAYLLGKQASAIAEKLEAFVNAKAPGKVRSLERSGYRLSIVEKPGSVSWKAEFVTALGQGEADRLVAAAPPKDDLVVEKL